VANPLFSPARDAERDTVHRLPR